MDEIYDECPECDGDGTIICWNCGGSGDADTHPDDEEVGECEECQGFGWIDCDWCDGNGEVPAK